MRMFGRVMSAILSECKLQKAKWVSYCVYFGSLPNLEMQPP